MAPLPLPPGPRRRFLSPSLLAMTDALGFLEKLRREHGNLVHFQLWRRPMVLINEPEIIRDVLVTNAAKFEKGVAGKFVRAFLGDSLLTSQGDSHRRQRRLVQPAFHRGRIREYAQAMIDGSSRFAAPWRDGQTCDVAAEMAHLTLEVIGSTMFSSNVRDDTRAVGDALTTTMAQLGRLQNPLMAMLIGILPVGRKFQQAQDELNAIILRIIRERRADPRDTGDLLSMLMLAEDADHPGEHLSDQEVRDQAMTIFLAGHETVAHALAWTWWLLAQHPEVEARLHAELRTVLGGRPPTVEDVPKLAWLDQVIRESMRLYPPAWCVGRMTIADHELAGCRIERGTVVLFSQWITHRDGRFFADPAAFRPERWTPEFRESLPKYVYLPFGAGPRTCIGEGFAWMELALVMANLAREWRFSLLPETRAEPQPRITLRPKGELLLRLHRHSAG